MAVRKFKPTTPGQRHKIIGTFEEITARVPEKSLVFGKKSSGGRNNTGKMTMRYIGGGSKKIIRIVDFKRNKDGDVNTIRYAGKNKSRYTRAGIINGRTNAYKKAVVTLKEGDTIDFYSNI